MYSDKNSFASLNDSLSEEFTVYKQGRVLNEDSIADFERYIQNVIPPELFNLYFFDGEKIADFFMEDNNGKRIKNAFLTLCGYDVFEIMRKNFKRLSSSAKNSPTLKEYIEAKEKYELLESENDSLQRRKDHNSRAISNINSELNLLEKSFKVAGGASDEEMECLIGSLKEEENNRANWNIEIKRSANDIIPFLMIKPLLLKLRTQLEAERQNEKYSSVFQVLKEKELHQYLENGYTVAYKVVLKGIQEYLFKKTNDSDEKILDLSPNQMAILQVQIDMYSAFNSNTILELKDKVKKSILKSAKIREKIDNMNVSLYKDYLNKKEQLLTEKQELVTELHEIELLIYRTEMEFQKAKSIFEKAKVKLKSELKNKSISDVSAKSIIMLDELQDVLYQKEIRKVEKNFKAIINTLMYKMNFISDIQIDDDFNVHLYRYEFYNSKDIVKIISGRNPEDIEKLWGSAALKMLRDATKVEDVGDIISVFNNKDCTLMMPIELNKETFSNGEKQIYIMALYYSIMMINTNEMPFIIDTPFARIDMEHRANISKYFFNKLKGQVFILSTDEEIDANHLKLLKNKIYTTYLLENKDNQKTVITANKYFEV